MMQLFQRVLFLPLPPPEGYNLTIARTSPFLYLLILLVCSTTTPVLGQQEVRSSHILSKKPVVAGSELVNETLTFLREGKQKMPFLDEIEVRTETDELNLSQQEYLMRFNLNQRQVRKAHNEITQSQIRLYDLKAQIKEEAELINRYELTLDWYDVQAELAYFAKLKQLLLDEKTVYSDVLTHSLELDLTDLLKVEKALQELDRKTLTLDWKREYMLQQLFSIPPPTTNLQLDTSRWVTLSTMAQVLKEAKEVPPDNLAQAIQDTRIEIEQLTFNRERAENNQVLDFVQLKYAGKDNLPVQQEFSLGLGFRIPTKASGRVKMNEAQIDIFDEEYKQALQRAKLDQKIASYYAAFEGVLEEHALLQKQMLANPLAETLQNYRKTGAVSPLVLLQIQESMLKNQKDLRELEKDACELYLNILSLKGLLSHMPLINYLSEDLEPY